MDPALRMLFQEYKTLRREAITYADVGYRTLQFLTALVSALGVLLAIKPGGVVISPFWGLALVQYFIFTIGVIQLSRIAYVFTIRQHLAELERRLNEAVGAESLTWECQVVQGRLQSPRNVTFQSQLILALAYSLVFIVVLALSVKYAHEALGGAHEWIYIASAMVEITVLIYLAFRVTKRQI